MFKYIIYFAIINKPGFPQASCSAAPVDMTAFDTQEEAEKYLENNYERIKASLKHLDSYNFYYFVQKTFIIQ